MNEKIFPSTVSLLHRFGKFARANAVKLCFTVFHHNGNKRLGAGLGGKHQRNPIKTIEVFALDFDAAAFSTLKRAAAWSK
jgi:hypothetical protein